jgi:hypothetical protein
MLSDETVHDNGPDTVNANGTRDVALTRLRDHIDNHIRNVPMHQCHTGWCDVFSQWYERNKDSAFFRKRITE